MSLPFDRHAWLARARDVPDACRGTHEALLRRRLRVLAPIAGVVTLAWIPLDLLWFGFQTTAPAVAIRLVLAVALLALGACVQRLGIGVGIHGFLWLQALGYGLLQAWLTPAHDTAPEIGYGLFPFVLAAQLALLPLPWLRGLVALLAPLGLLVATVAGEASRDAGRWNDIWLFLLIGAIALWSSQAQLRLLVDLLDARADATHDPLTGLDNRRAALARLQVECKRVARGHAAPAVLSLDLDHFKRINDRWGHATGDRVLIAVAAAMRSELRAIDVAARYGGEEFLALLPETDGEAALQVAERVRARIASQRIVLDDGSQVSVTASLGVAELRPGESGESVLMRADNALYRAKSEGRDRCVLAE
jgi:diguanylate cyclase (GGDEF)-like protein